MDIISSLINSDAVRTGCYTAADCVWFICGGWIDQLCCRLDQKIKVKDILKEKEKQEMKKHVNDVNESKNLGTLTMSYGEEQLEHALTRRISADAYEQKEREALIERIKAMDAKQLAIVAECIPVEVCLDRIAKEYAQLKAMRDAITNTIGNFN